VKASQLAARSISVAGALALLAAAGSQIFDSMWLGLIPAASLLALGMIAMSLRATDVPIARAVMVFTGASAGFLASLAVFGLIIQGHRFEPPWLAGAISTTGWAFVIALTIFGLDSARRRTLPRGVSILIAAAIPMGLAADRALEFLPGEFFLAHIVPNVAIAVFGIALVRAGFKMGRVSTARRSPFPQG
jgi:hypothetical protein